MYECIERDWKLFKSKLPDWQENYIEKKIEEYKELLNSDLEASTKFWHLDEKIKEDKKNPGVLLVSISRSRLFEDILFLLNYKVITLSDLDDFSDSLKENINFILELKKRH